MQQFTEEELRKYNGQDGMPAYIAYKGQVYDVSASKFWQNGSHFKKHFAGCDLTSEMANAPHSDEVFENYPCVGQFLTPSLIVPETKKERYRRWYAAYHPHPMVIHFPIALHYFSAAADILFLANPSAEYESAVFLSFLIATLMGFVALITGVFSWWVNYDFSTSKPFVIKLIGALFTLIIGVVPLIQKLLNPDVPFSTGVDGITYHAVIFITVISITIVGYYGGKITWGARQ
jgi:predicted heme/steroid binding protein/uncharacterized membrane protein